MKYSFMQISSQINHQYLNSYFPLSNSQYSGINYNYYPNNLNQIYQNSNNIKSCRQNYGININDSDYNKSKEKIDKSLISSFKYSKVNTNEISYSINKMQPIES